MPFDEVTQHQLEHQHGLMRKALHDQSPPDRKEALRIQLVVDDILDRRARPIAVAADGEIIWDNVSPWIASQGVPIGETMVVNSTGQAEVVMTEDGVGGLLPEIGL